MPTTLRLTVLVEAGRRDVLVPAGIRVGELVEELARGDGGDGRPGFGEARTLVRADGGALELGRDLHEQARDGDVLALVPMSGLAPRDVVDDPVDAVRSVVRSLAVSANGVPAATQLPVDHATLRAAGVLGSAVLAAVALLRAPATGPAPLLLAVAAGVAGALLLRRGADRPDDASSRPTSTTGAAALASGGVLALAECLRGTSPGPGSALRAGLVLLVLGAALVLSRPRRPAPALAVAVPGALLLAGAAALTATDVSTSQAAAVLAVVAVVLARAVPWATASAARLDRVTTVRPAGESDPAATGGVDLDAVAATVSRTRPVTRAGVLGAGLTCALLTPLVVAGGPRGALLVVALAGLLGLQGRAPAEPGLRHVGAVCSVLVLLVGCVSTLVLLPALAPAVAGLAGLAALSGLAVALVAAAGGPTTPLPGRATAALETTLLLGLLPLLALALGLLPTPWSGW